MLYYTLKKLGNIGKIVSRNLKVCQPKNLLLLLLLRLSLSISWYGNSNFCLVFKGTCLKEKSTTYIRPNRINFFIVYELDTWSRDLYSDFTLKPCLFGGVNLAKNSDLDKYVYSGYGVEFNSVV